MRKLFLFGVFWVVSMGAVPAFGAAGWVQNVTVEKLMFTKHHYAPNGDTSLGDADHGGVFVEVSGSLAVSNCGQTGRNRFFFNVKKPREEVWAVRVGSYNLHQEFFRC